jgi:uncharacterized cupredoxin-like copper-binding protein
VCCAMRSIQHSVFRGFAAIAALLMVLPLLAVAAAPLSSASAQGAPAITIVSPSDGATITSNDIVVQVKVENFTVDCSQLGRPDQDGVGQILALVDGTTVAQLTNFYCSDTFTVPGAGITPGSHQLAIALASNTHVPMMETAQVVTIDFQPVQPVPLPVAYNAGAAALTLVSPLDGATVPPTFTVQVQPTNFIAAESLEGKANVAGYGHYHVWVDAPEMPTSLANLVLMPGTNAFTLNLSAWGEGAHTIRIEPAENNHAMVDPATPVTFTVTVSASATPEAASSPASAATAEAGAAQGATTVELVDIAFNPTEFTIAANQDVVVTLTNSGATMHNFSISDNQNPNVANLGISVDVQPGETTTVTINAAAGDYYYFCNVPGHEAAGMHGVMHVQ